MALSFRQTDIIEIARREGKVTVEELAERFNVTLQTIRRDLTELAEAGKLDRVHGGAILPSGTTNIAYEERRALNQSAKADIARACAAQIPDDCSIFLNIGTTTEAVARALTDHKGLMAVTNNLNVAEILSDNENCNVIVTGGSLRRKDGGLVGPLAAQSIEQFKFDTAVIGCSALDTDGDILDFDILEVGVSQAILKHSRRVILVADHTKLLRSAPARIGSLAAVDRVITDKAMPQSLMQRCRDWGTEVTCVGTA